MAKRKRQDLERMRARRARAERAVRLAIEQEVKAIAQAGPEYQRLLAEDAVVRRALHRVRIKIARKKSSVAVHRRKASGQCDGIRRLRTAEQEELRRQNQLLAHTQAILDRLRGSV